MHVDNNMHHVDIIMHVDMLVDMHVGRCVLAGTVPGGVVVVELQDGRVGKHSGGRLARARTSASRACVQHTRGVACMREAGSLLLARPQAQTAGNLQELMNLGATNHLP